MRSGARCGYHVSCSRPATDLQRAVSVAIVGSGPAGMYTADELLRCARPPRAIHIFERRVLPFGLLRYGVAPDHAEVRLVEHKFHDEVLDDPAVQLFGRVEVGRDVSLAQLCAAYDAVFLCHGAASSRYLPLAAAGGGLGVDGASVAYGERQYVSSQQFVGWYNGDPEQAGRSFDLDGVTDVAIVGAGNVALDIARLLLKPPELLEETDMARPALAALRSSRVARVTVVARRGPAHAAFATKELRELSLLPGLDLETDVPAVRRAAEEATQRPQRRLLQLLADAASRPSRGPAARRLCFRFAAAPLALSVDEHGRARALLTEGGGAVPAQLVVAAVGYCGHSPDPVLAPMAAGDAHLQNAAGQLRPGLYATGWAKRGASGIVATNKFCAAETVQAFLRDELRPEKPGVPPALPPHALSREQMEALEHAEKTRGQGRFTSFAEIQACLDEASARQIKQRA